MHRPAFETPRTALPTVRGVPVHPSLYPLASLLSRRGYKASAIDEVVRFAACHGTVNGCLLVMDCDLDEFEATLPESAAWEATAYNEPLPAGAFAEARL